MNKDSKIYIAGHRGLVGSAIERKLRKEGYENIITRTSQELDLRIQKDVDMFFHFEKPEYVFLAAAKAGGVLALDTYRANAIYDNLMIQTNVIHSAWDYKVKKLMFIGSNCVYSPFVAQPIKEEYLLAGTLEPTTEHYAVAKIAGIKMCEAYRHQYGCNFITALPVNLYGQNDNAHPEHSHVMVALMSKFKDAIASKKNFVEIWGTGTARREFMHVDDFANAALFLMLNYNESKQINVGTGTDISIHDLAVTIKRISGYEGELVFNTSKPDGTRSKLFDVSKLHNLGWKYKIELEEGIKKVYEAL